MTKEQINSILKQIESGKVDSRYVYRCCGESFLSLYDFRKHLFERHPEEMELHFEEALHRELPTKPSAEEVHRKANKGKKIKEKALKKKEEKQTRKRNHDAYPTPSKGDSFHLIYTPMGNKR